MLKHITSGTLIYENKWRFLSCVRATVLGHHVTTQQEAPMTVYRSPESGASPSGTERSPGSLGQEVNGVRVR